MLHIFDLDDTLIHEGFPPEERCICRETLEVLNYLKAQNHRLAVASHNNMTEQRLRANGILHYFDIVQGYPPAPGTFTKRTHVEIILAFYDNRFAPQDVVFYDDLYEVIHDLKTSHLGIGRCKLVNWEVGIELSDIETNVLKKDKSAL